MLLTQKIKSSQGVFFLQRSLLSLSERPSLLVPLFVGLLLTIMIRVWLTIYTHGVIAGDEAMVGIQAEHILRGEHPFYYYGQPYMGSFEAYLMAGLFLLFGPSVWAFRAEPILVSLVLVFLTWSFARAVADTAHLSRQANICFVTIATLIAAFPPLYDMVEEMRAQGGYIEAFTLMLWFLLCAWSLTSRWQHAKTRERFLGWAGLGFLIGFGLWINPLVAYGLVTILLWFGLFLIAGILKPESQDRAQRRSTWMKEVALVLSALPAALVGFSPALYWGSKHQWENIHFILFTEADGYSQGLTLQERVHSILRVGKAYLTCMAPRTLGGALPTQPDVTAAHPHIITFGLLVATGCLLVCAGAFALSLIWPHATLRQLRHLTALPLLFCGCASTLFVTSSVASRVLGTPCGPWDVIGRYTVPLVIVLPFVIATVFTLPLMIRNKVQTLPGSEEGSRKRRMRFANSELAFLKIMLLLGLVTYFGVQAVAYKTTDPGYTFQDTDSRLADPKNNDPIIAYMEQEHIHYAWGSGWIGDPITFKTNERIIVTQPDGRIQADDDAVLHADRASLLLLVRRNDRYPAILRSLDALHVQYRIGRFSSEPGVDALVVTPLHHTLSPFDPRFADVFRDVFDNHY
jgi:hypothetical protein